MTITVLYNKVTSLFRGDKKDLLADEDTVKTAISISESLQILGHKAQLFELNENSVKDLLNINTDLFFNNAFGIGNTDKSEFEIPQLLTKTKKPYTGSSSKAIVLTTNKNATKEVLMANNLPTPGSVNFPLIVKPNNEDCSFGISSKSVVNNKAQLEAQIKYLTALYSEDILIEEYIDGREVNVTVLGNGKSAQALPISEITFGPSFKDKAKIVDFDAKWEELSLAYTETVGVCPANLPTEATKRIQDIAKKAIEVTGCADCTRVDFRLDKNLNPFILEVNANPSIGPGDGATRSAKAAGFTYSEFLQKIIDAAILRFQN